MSLFQCDRCGCVENTALSEGGYLISGLVTEDEPPEIVKSYKAAVGLKEEEPFGNYCCVCCPMQFDKKGEFKIFEEKDRRQWHSDFPRTFLAKGEWETDERGNLRNKKTGQVGWKGQAVPAPEGI